jgi:hypothetical protein
MALVSRSQIQCYSFWRVWQIMIFNKFRADPIIYKLAMIALVRSIMFLEMSEFDWRKYLRQLKLNQPVLSYNPGDPNFLDHSR